MYSILRTFLELLPRKEATTKAETGIFAPQVWELVLWESPVTFEHFYSSLLWIWNLINAQTEGQAGLGFLVHVSPSVLVPKAMLEAAPLQSLSPQEQKACMEETLLLQGAYSKSGSVCFLSTQLAAGCFFT